MRPDDDHDADRLRRLNALLAHALTLTEPERDAWLRDLTDAQQPLATPLRALLARVAPGTDDFMRRPVEVVQPTPGGDLDSEPLDEQQGEQPGELIGPYRLLRALGSGGMATVWLAERHDGALTRQVALKLPRIGWAPGLAERMQRERDILARLEHPNIARLYDAGVAAGGRPYLAMEYVDGLPIDVFAREQRLSVAARLQLALQVAAAVAYAHGRLVIHRDLKPSNILVTSQGEVRLLDFGVAKLLQGGDESDDGPPRGDGGAGPLTEFAGLAFTREYASPEQIAGAPLTVASDVYSLGVVLYELLTGVRPHGLRRAAPPELDEALIGDDLTPASRRADDPALARALRGDLDNILAKALRSRPAWRYSSVEALAEDIRRHLQRLPVSARPATLAYRLSRHARRHRAALAAAAVLVASILGGAGAALWQGHEAAHQRDRALQRLARNDAVAEFLELMFTQGVPEGQVQVVRQMLERSEPYADPAYGYDGEHQAAVLLMLATQYSQLAEAAQASRLLQRAEDLLQRSSDRDLRAQVECTHALMLGHLGRHGDAIARLDRWIESRDIDDNVVAFCLLRRTERALASWEAEPALRFAESALARLQRARHAAPVVRAVAHQDHALALHMNGRGIEADAAFARAMDAFTAIGRAQTADAIALRANWATIRMTSGDVAQGLALCEAALAAQLAVAGRPSLVLLTNCALGSELLGRFDEAALRFAQVLAAVDSTGDAQTKVLALSGLASVALQRGDIAAARAQLQGAQSVIAAADFQPQNAALMRHRLVGARMQMHDGRPQDALMSLNEVIDRLEASRTRHGALSIAYRLRGEARAAAGAHAAAEADLRRALVIAQELQAGRTHSLYTGLAWLALARLQRDRGEMTEAEASRRLALDHVSAIGGPAHPVLREAQGVAAATN